MFSDKCDSVVIKETLKTLCCNNGWCYGVFWGFDQSKTLLLTLKDAYYEEQMGSLIDSMLPQVHVLGGGVIGQVAFTHNHQWIYSDTHHDSRNTLTLSYENFELFQDDSEFYNQFFIGIKTIGLISIEPWGVVQFGSTHKNPETKGFVHQVKNLFREVRFQENESPSSSQILDPTTRFSSEGSMEANDHHLMHPSSRSFPSTTTNPVEDYYLLKPTNFSDCLALTSSWPPSKSEEIKDMFNTQNLAPLTDSKAQRPCGLLTMEELFQESDPADEFSRWFSPQSRPALNTNTTTATATATTNNNNNNNCNSSFTSLLTTATTTTTTADLSHSTGLIPLSSLSGSKSKSPIHMSETNSIQSSLTLGSSNPDVKYSGAHKPIFASGCKRMIAWDETLVPVGEKYAGAPSQSSLFSKLGLDQLLDGSGVTATGTTGSCSFARPEFEDRSSNPFAKRRKTESCPSSPNHVKSEGIFSFDGKMKSLKSPVFEPRSEGSIGDSCFMEGGNTSSSERQEETEKTEKKKTKAKAGTKPRPKDRQMIQDRLAELRELIPNGEKMSIDRLLERTIRHLNFMQSLIKHAESLKEINKPKSWEISKNKDGSGVTWACEVGDRSMGCPLVIEDLATPGKMLIEMLCEEQGFFLEISDVIRGFGFIILKGVMEVREPKKIWAHFLVQAEGTRCVTRHELFSSLIQLLQMRGQNAAGASVIIPSVNNCQPAVRFPINLTDALQCADL